MQTIQTSTESETRDFANTIANNLVSGDILLMEGPLGAGKSIIARQIIRKLCNQPQMEVPSPTFTLVQQYDYANGYIWHFDLYRLEDPEEIFELGWEEALETGIVIVEWPQRLGTYTPRKAKTIHITPSGNQRTITFKDGQKV